MSDPAALLSSTSIPTQVAVTVSIESLQPRARRLALAALAHNFGERFVEEQQAADAVERHSWREWVSNDMIGQDEAVCTVEVDGKLWKLDMEMLWCDPVFCMEGKLSGVNIYYNGCRCGKPFPVRPQDKEGEQNEKMVTIFLDTGRGGKRAYRVPASVAA